jgi:hypothetical protein
MRTDLLKGWKAHALSLLMAAMVVLFPYPAKPQPAPDMIEVKMEQQANGDTIYTASIGHGESCIIQWDFYKAGWVRHRSQCRLPLKEQIPLIQRILAEVSKDRVRFDRMGPFSLGRISEHSELSLRLAIAAHKSPLWDSRTGRPKSGRKENSAVLQIAEQNSIFREFDQALARFNRKLTLRAAEKVLILPASKLDFFDRLKPLGVRDTDRLPFDFVPFFSALPIEADGTQRPTQRSNRIRQCMGRPTWQS